MSFQPGTNIPEYDKTKEQGNVWVECMYCMNSGKRTDTTMINGVKGSVTITCPVCGGSGRLSPNTPLPSWAKKENV